MASNVQPRYNEHAYNILLDNAKWKLNLAGHDLLQWKEYVHNHLLTNRSEPVLATAKSHPRALQKRNILGGD